MSVESCKRVTSIEVGCTEVDEGAEVLATDMMVWKMEAELLRVEVLV